MIFLKCLPIFIFLLLACHSHSASAQTADLVIIEKSERRLTLKKGDVKLAEYTVALGGKPVGPKHCQGDNKTPEGTYRIVNRNRQSAFHRSLRISYPSRDDIAYAKRIGCAPGGDIMIHGLPNGSGWLGAAHRLKDWTLGCIAVTNSEIEEIWKLVPDSTVVKILP